MALVRDDIRDAIGEVYNALRDDVFFASTDTLFLLKASSTLDEFEEVLEVSNWFFENDTDFSIRVRIAESFQDLTDSVEEATHLKVNDDVYVISRGDIKPPMGTRMFWEMLAERYTRPQQYTNL